MQIENKTVNIYETPRARALRWIKNTKRLPWLVSPMESMRMAASRGIAGNVDPRQIAAGLHDYVNHLPVVIDHATVTTTILGTIQALGWPTASRTSRHIKPFDQAFRLAMDTHKNDLDTALNLFGLAQKYGVSELAIKTRLARWERGFRRDASAIKRLLHCLLSGRASFSTLHTFKAAKNSSCR